MRPASKHLNPVDSDGKPIKENPVSDRNSMKESAEQFVKKEAPEDVIDEDHPPVAVRETIVKPKMKQYLSGAKKSNKNQPQSTNKKHKSAEKLEKALEKLNKRSE